MVCSSIFHNGSNPLPQMLHYNIAYSAPPKPRHSKPHIIRIDCRNVVQAAAPKVSIVCAPSQMSAHVTQAHNPPNDSGDTSARFSTQTMSGMEHSGNRLFSSQRPIPSISSCQKGSTNSRDVLKPERIAPCTESSGSLTPLETASCSNGTFATAKSCCKTCISGHLVSQGTAARNAKCDHMLYKAAADRSKDTTDQRYITIEPLPSHKDRSPANVIVEPIIKLDTEMITGPSLVDNEDCALETACVSSGILGSSSIHCSVPSQALTCQVDSAVMVPKSGSEISPTFSIVTPTELDGDADACVSDVIGDQLLEVTGLEIVEVVETVTDCKGKTCLKMNNVLLLLKEILRDLDVHVLEKECTAKESFQS